MIVGLASNGIHSNGITIARKVMNDENLEELTKPTEIYLKAVKEILKSYRKDIHGMAHITGGGFKKMIDIINENIDIVINRKHKIEPQSIFKLIKERGNLSDGEMYKTFNNGIGFILVVEKSIVDDVLSILRKYHKADIIGFAEKGSGKIRIESQYSDKTIVIQ